MNTTKWSVAILAALVAWPACSILAQQPPASGHVLVLENERVLEGDIVRDGEQYRIRHHVGETTVPAKTVVALCADMNEAYAFMHGRSNLEDPDERMRLARWCRQHSLRAAAITELQAALRLDPERTEAKRLLQVLQQPRPTVVTHVSVPTQKAPEPVVDISAESMSLFTTRIQPILMNTCVRCHARQDVGSFRLIRVFGNPGIAQPTSRHNLAVTLGQVNRQRPQASPLLTKALSLHGSADRPPLKDRNTPAYRQLEAWVQMQAQPAPVTEEAEARPENKPVAKDVLPTVPTPVPAAETVAAGGTFAGDRKDDAVQTPKNRTVPVDPFDPVLFNQLAHPEKK
ncbi:MAG TPA: hypothetical protein VFA18_14945 [Gemmataceae bacterium]|nr:hypothetical protein [Gemmataceae bacterium]